MITVKICFIFKLIKLKLFNLKLIASNIELNTRNSTSVNSNQNSRNQPRPSAPLRIQQIQRFSSRQTDSMPPPYDQVI